MKLEIENKLASKPVPPVTLGLRKDGPSIVLVVIKSGRIENQLLSFNTDGTVEKFASIREEYGFDLNEKRQLNIEERP